MFHNEKDSKRSLLHPMAWLNFRFFLFLIFTRKNNCFSPYSLKNSKFNRISPKSLQLSILFIVGVISDNFIFTYNTCYVGRIIDNTHCYTTTTKSNEVKQFKIKLESYNCKTLVCELKIKLHENFHRMRQSLACQSLAKDCTPIFSTLKSVIPTHSVIFDKIALK